MQKRDLIITISPTGEVSFEVKGVKGAACLSATKFLEEALGGAVLEREKTSEFYEAGETGQVGQYAGEGEGSEES